MNYWEEQRYEMPSFVGSGKTYAGLLAYWRLMQTPAEGEDVTGGAVDERFTPVSEEGLEQRIALLDSMIVSPLPEEIEDLADSSRFLASPEGENGATETGSRPGEEGSLLQAAARPARAPFMTSAEVVVDGMTEQSLIPVPYLRDEWVKAFSTVLLVWSGEGGTAVANWGRAAMARPITLYACEKVLNDPHTDYAAPRRAEFESLHYMVSSHNEQLRDAVQSCFSLRTSITVVVDNVGAARDPNAALESLIADATCFGAAEDEDGTRALVVTAPPAPASLPAVAQQCRHEVVGRPRVAVMELPGDPPHESPQQKENGEPSALLKRLMKALAAL
ncbi:hypothetical protein [Streptomyces sp. NPDC047043]|uniref:hypothetical protein n=1 Tax=Streptomyces sp. NPDC047043 TaxID=3154497 RepID=UPI0033C0D2CE